MLIPLPLNFPIKRVSEGLVAHLSVLSREKNPVIKDVWQAYQDELALEKIFYGRPYHRRNATYAVNLGPGTAWPGRSATDTLEFIALEQWHACQGDDMDLPPLQIWTEDQVQVSICIVIMMTIP